MLGAHLNSGGEKLHATLALEHRLRLSVGAAALAFLQLGGFGEIPLALRSRLLPVSSSHCSVNERKGCVEGETSFYPAVSGNFFCVETGIRHI